MTRSCTGSSCAVLKEELLPGVKDRWRELVLVAEVGDRHVFDQIERRMATFLGWVHFLRGFRIGETPPKYSITRAWRLSISS